MGANVGYAAQRAFSASKRTAASLGSTRFALQNRLNTTSRAWTCPECWSRQRLSTRANTAWQRPLSTTSRRLDEADKRPSDGEKKPIDPPVTITPPASDAPQDAAPATPSPSSPVLPSESAQQRSPFSKRTSELMDTVLTRLSTASQRINNYTGTDYSGIESVRQEILAVEDSVRDRHKAVDDARTNHTEALAQQASAQKEIVSLLERKSSWSPSDLERYMSLVRSEHTNEQAVQTGKEGLMSAERDLENARSLIERLERKRYHEEQIWSDTIRRNSTWVTFGLMGVNIILLLAQISVFEPYRRKKIVREVKAALDEKALVAAPAVEAERQVGEAVELASVPLGVVLKQDAIAAEPAQEPHGEVSDPVLATGEMLPEEAVESTQPLNQPPGEPQAAETWTQMWDAYQDVARDLFSERMIQIRKVDLTSVALQGAATGVAAVGLLFILLRPR